MNRLVRVISLLAGALIGNSALAQTDTAFPSPLGPAPLATDSRPAVGQAGIPLGAIELAPPGISPDAFTACSPATGSTGTMFDGGGMSPAPPATCDMTGNALPSTTTMTSTPSTITGRAGIPLGSVELGLPGLSPAPPSTPLVSSFATSGIGTPCPGASSSPVPGSC